jgi:recombinational DNA repair ATPase RecF
VSIGPANDRPHFGITEVEVKGFRSARDVSFSPGPVCALVGEANAGKSNLIAAIRSVLDPAAPPLTAADAAEGGDGQISIRVKLAGGGVAALNGTPGRHALTGPADLPTVLLLPADACRGGPGRPVPT